MQWINDVKYVVFPRCNTGILSLIEQEQLSNILLKLVDSKEQFLVVSYKEPFAEKLLEQAVIMKYGKYVKITWWDKLLMWMRRK